ncbi:MAG: methyltransferase [Clostridia bacterium]|nr:methyltransferase [Clostridia bacterium]
MKYWETLTDAVGLYRTEPYPIHEDALRLAEFSKNKPQDRVIDCGTGNGVLAVYAEALYGGQFTGIDIDRAALALAEESAARNGQAISFQLLSVTDAPAQFGHGSFDRALMNPPYFTSGDKGARALSRHADEGLLSDWCHAAFLLLNNGGTLTLCYPASQLAVLFRALEQNRLAPKRMELLYSGDAARLALVEAKKLGGDGMKITRN